MGNDVAIAEIAIGQQFARFKQFRGKGLIGSAVGAGLGLGYSLGDYYEWTVPWDAMLQPDRTKRSGLSVSPQTESGSAYQYGKTYNKSSQIYRSRRRNCSNRHNRCCICGS